MSERIKDGTLGFMLMCNAIGELDNSCDGDGIKATEKINQNADGQEGWAVEFKVNGVDLPFAKVIEFWERSFDKMIEERAGELALKALSREGLDRIVNALEYAEWEIKETLRKKFPNLDMES